MAGISNSSRSILPTVAVVSGRLSWMAYAVRKWSRSGWRPCETPRSGSDARCAHHYADIVTRRVAAGRPIDARDAVCRRHDVPLVTRNVKDFEGTGIAVINPWEPA